jgi:hypothetical protein
MATIEDLITQIQAERDMETQVRDRAIATVKAIIAKANQEGRSKVTEEEDADVKAAFERRNRAITNLTGIESKLKSAERVRDAERETDIKLAERSGDRHDVAAKPAYDRVARIGAEERTYHEGNDRKGVQFLQDVARQYLLRDPESEVRLVRHMQEERVERGQYVTRASNTGNFAGLTVPQYLTNMYAPAVANLRPFADVCNHHDLPDAGMTVNISRITTPTSVGLQATENSTVSNQDIDDTLLTENVQTAAGYVTLSRQAIDRGTGVEEITMNDLFRRYASTLDNTLILQATTGLKAVAATQTYTDASPTTPKIISQIVGAASTVESTLLGFAQPDTVVMHPRRWYSLMGAFSSSWPMVFNPNSAPPLESTGVNADQPYGKGIRGVLQNGMRVCVDANLETNLGAGTNQDQIYVVPSQECHLWEDPSAPVFIRAEQPQANTLGVMLVLYGYFAYSFRRYGSGATVKIDGTGLITPTFLGA